MKSKVCFARYLFYGEDGTNGINGIDRENREFKELRERLSLNSLISLNSLNSLIYHLNQQKTNFLLEGVRFGLSQK